MRIAPPRRTDRQDRAGRKVKSIEDDKSIAMPPEVTPPDWAALSAPDGAVIEAIALRILAALPAPIRQQVEGVGILVEEMADEALLDALGIDDPLTLTGLYDGIPLTERSVADEPTQPDLIRLYRLPILVEWAGRGDVTLGEIVAHVLIHEIAHHFGFSDEGIAAIDRWWE